MGTSLKRAAGTGDEKHGDFAKHQVAQSLVCGRKLTGLRYESQQPHNPIMFEIRAAKTEDKESIRQIYRSSVGSEAKMDESYWDHLIRVGAVLVAQVESRIIGFGGIDVQASEQVKWLYLLPQHQGAGVGSEILQRLERIGVSAGLESLRLHSSPGAVEFYLRHGYREVDQAHRIGHDHAGVEMVKDLGAR